MGAKLHCTRRGDLERAIDLTHLRWLPFTLVKPSRSLLVSKLAFCDGSWRRLHPEPTRMSRKAAARPSHRHGSRWDSISSSATSAARLVGRGQRGSKRTPFHGHSRVATSSDSPRPAPAKLQALLCPCSMRFSPLRRLCLRSASPPRVSSRSRSRSSSRSSALQSVPAL
eukprot:Amastigsp_a678067_66.p4 type:complete len:169 gc:universal Amastigsp_a678067_66:1531-1025(-)